MVKSVLLIKLVLERSVAKTLEEVIMSPGIYTVVRF